MLGALVYLQVRQAKNRWRERLRRLRNPRYLLGALAGVLYFGLFFSRTLYFGTMRRSPRGMNLPPDGWETVAALGLFVLLLLAWVVPRARAALVFTEAEIAFLFPAPIRRQTLIHYKLIRSQAGVLATVLFLTLLTRWQGGVGSALLRVAGWWVLLTTINLHLLGASFARTLLLDQGITVWRRRALVLSAVAALVAGTVYWTGQTLPAFDPDRANPVGSVLSYLSDLARSPAVALLLTPFRVMLRPFLQSDHPAAFAASIGPAAGILLLHYFWVVRSDVAFEEASIAVSQRHAERVAAVREGRGAAARPSKRRRAPFRLSPTGPPAVAILWKNLLSAGQLFNVRLAVTLIATVAVAGSSFGGSAGRAAWPQVVGMLALFLAGWSFVLGPQVVRQDFRQDMAVADLLKAYPLRGWQVALGELLAPALILTVAQYVLIALAATLLGGADETPEAWRGRAALAAAAAVLAPPLNLVTLLVPNSAAVLFPAWFAGQAGPAGTRGVEVVGGRLIFLLGQMIALALALLPAGLAYFVVSTLFTSQYVPRPYDVPVAACVTALVFAAEAAAGLTLLGHWFEKHDPSTERPG